MPSKPPFLSTDTKKSTVTGAEGGTPTADFTVDSLFPHSLACSSWGRQEKTEDSVGVREGPAYGRCVHFTAAIPTLKMSCPLLLHLYNRLKKNQENFGIDTLSCPNTEEELQPEEHI